MKIIAYQSYLLRLWLEKHDEVISWRASMEDPHTGQQLFFFLPADLYHFLEKLIQDLNMRENAE
ncbi:MAG: hypothetical protein ACK2TV_01230 [Anaerolineales bacterium]